MPPAEKPPSNAPPGDRYRRFSVGRLLALTTACGVCLGFVRFTGPQVLPGSLVVLAVLTIPILFGTWAEVARGLVVSIGIVGGGMAPVILAAILDFRSMDGGEIMLIGIGAAAGGWCAARGWNRWLRRRENRRQEFRNGPEG